MIYPDKIKKGDTIGICAPSGSVIDKVKKMRLKNAHRNLKNYGYKVIETAHVQKDTLDPIYNEIKARELEELYLNPDVKYIMCASGGDFLIEILNFINFDIIKNNIKWLQGYSDPTGLLYTITTNYDIATIYGYNATTYGMSKWHPSITSGLAQIEGISKTQKSFTYYQETHTEYKTGLEGFLEEKRVKWKGLHQEKEITMQGRIIGGCLDVILNIIGTKYDKTKEYVHKYRNDGIIWYFDNFGLDNESLIRAMWQLKNAGYFDYCKGIVFGRSNRNESFYNISFKEALARSLDDLNVPIIYDADIGHKDPTITIINGSLATITLTNGKGQIIQEYH